jgi:hypothetical protein
MRYFLTPPRRTKEPLVQYALYLSDQLRTSEQMPSVSSHFYDSYLLRRHPPCFTLTVPPRLKYLEANSPLVQHELFHCCTVAVESQLHVHAFRFRQRKKWGTGHAAQPQSSLTNRCTARARSLGGRWHHCYGANQWAAVLTTECESLIECCAVAMQRLCRWRHVGLNLALAEAKP